MLLALLIIIIVAGLAFAWLTTPPMPRFPRDDRDLDLRRTAMHAAPMPFYVHLFA